MQFQSTTFLSKSMLCMAVSAATAMFIPIGHDDVYAQHSEGHKGGHSDGHKGGHGGADKGHSGGGHDGQGKGAGRDSGSAVEEDVMRGKGKYSDFIREDHSDHADGTDHVSEEGDDSDKEDSDRPDHAGPDATAPKPGRGGNEGGALAGGRGDLFGDLWVIVRDPLTGEPILYVWQDTDNDGELEPVKDADGFPQPIDAQGNLIPLDEEGSPIDESLVQDVELGRLNVARAPETVLVHSYDAVLDTLNAATDVRTDASGRLEALVDGVWVSIDSPLENLALYISLIDDGTIEGLENNAITSVFPNLVDGKLNTTDIQMASAFFAAAADKVDTVSLDAVMYINNIIGVEMDSQDLKLLTSYTYDRASIYSDLTATILVDPEQDGTWVTQTVNIYDVVFDSANVKVDGATGFSQAIDDARAVVNFLHEYAVPVYDIEAAPE